MEERDVQKAKGDENAMGRKRCNHAHLCLTRSHKKMAQKKKFSANFWQIVAEQLLQVVCFS